MVTSCENPRNLHVAIFLYIASCLMRFSDQSIARLKSPVSQNDIAALFEVYRDT